MQPYSWRHDREQQLLCTRIATHDDRLTFEPETLEGLKYVGGVDLSFPEDNMEEALACLSVLEWPSLEVNALLIMHITQHLLLLANNRSCIHPT